MSKTEGFKLNFDNKRIRAGVALGALLLVFIGTSLAISLNREKTLKNAETEKISVFDEEKTLSACGEEYLPVSGMELSAGAGNFLDLYYREDECMESCIAEAYGYENLGIANVDNHLNIRQEPHEGGKLVGKMSNNAACEILGYEGDWFHIKSGDVEGYCFSEYLLIGELALLRAKKVIVKEAVSTSGGLRVRGA